MMKSQNSAIGRSHVVWLDVVRFVAMFTVVCCHSADPFNFYPGEPPANIDQIKFWGAAYGSFLRPCVPRSEERRVGKECRSRWSPYH